MKGGIKMFKEDVGFYEKVSKDANYILENGFFLSKEKSDNYYVGKVSEILFFDNLFCFLPESCFNFDSRRGVWGNTQEHSGWSFDITHRGGKFSDRILGGKGPSYVMTIFNDDHQSTIEFYEDIDLLKKRIKSKLSEVAYKKLPNL